MSSLLMVRCSDHGLRGTEVLEPLDSGTNRRLAKALGCDRYPEVRSFASIPYSLHSSTKLPGQTERCGQRQDIRHPSSRRFPVWLAESASQAPLHVAVPDAKQSDVSG